MNLPLKIAIAGLGTVGVATLKLLTNNKDIIRCKSSRPLVVTAVSARNRCRDRDISLEGLTWHDDPVQMARVAEADVVVELIGGAGDPARSVCEAAIHCGRHVVTANKALLAHHGAALARAAEAAQVTLAFEAAVAGGIPIIKALREGLAPNRLSRVYGILNGTCNYILTTMRESGRDFADVLQEAQALGYAEADPSFDIDGLDTAHKLALLTSLAFGTEPEMRSVYVEGIRHVSAADISYANELGYRIKLLGIARRTENGIEQRVHPSMVALSTTIASVDGVLNAVVAEGDSVGRSVYVGRGAGGGPTASAVVADLIDIAAGRDAPTFGVVATALTRSRSKTTAMTQHRSAFYVRLMVVDKPGVFADVAAALRDEQVSMESVLQRSRDPGEIVPVVMTLHDTEEQAMLRALRQIESLAAVVESPRLIRIECL